jgi:hypothetical protein
MNALPDSTSETECPDTLPKTLSDSVSTLGTTTLGLIIIDSEKNGDYYKFFKE